MASNLANVSNSEVETFHSSYENLLTEMSPYHVKEAKLNGIDIHFSNSYIITIETVVMAIE
jgi:hypothetical protein